LILAAWTDEHRAAARAEGWDLFATSGSTSKVQVQRIDDPEELGAGVTHLASDSVAWGMVRTGTGEHHRVARQIIQGHSPLEWEMMKDAQ
jgi:hypothetical protein